MASIEQYNTDHRHLLEKPESRIRIMHSWVRSDENSEHDKIGIDILFALQFSKRRLLL